jgi:hypothetical protein
LSEFIFFIDRSAIVSWAPKNGQIPFEWGAVSFYSNATLLYSLSNKYSSLSTILLAITRVLGNEKSIQNLEISKLSLQYGMGAFLFWSPCHCATVTGDGTSRREWLKLGCHQLYIFKNIWYIYFATKKTNLHPPESLLHYSFVAQRWVFLLLACVVPEAGLRRYLSSYLEYGCSFFIYTLGCTVQGLWSCKAHPYHKNNIYVTLC